MENWQKIYIEENLPVLIEITTCSEGVKTRLRAKKLLTKEEDDRLAAQARNHGLISEAKLLYEIMMTRPRGYNGLIDVLCDTRQEGAFQILQDGLQRKESKVLSDGSATQLLKTSLQLANCTKSFHDVFPSFTLDDARELLRNPQLKQEFEELLLKGSLEIRLDGELPLTSELYIPRQLSNRLHMDPKVFSLSSCEDVFVFTNIDIMELKQLVKPHATRSSTGQRGLVTARHIYLDDEEDWDDMTAMSELPVHLISKEDGGYILQRSTKVTHVLQSYVLREGRSKEAFVTEDEFVDILAEENESKGALICDVAGMGKTWFMQSLAAKLRQKNENFVVFFIELSSFSRFLSAPDQTPSDNRPLTTVLNYTCPSKSASYLLNKHAIQNRLQIVFILDGYDEFSYDEIEVVKVNLLELSKLDHIKMIISSRPNMRASLQKTFNLISHDILPFQSEEQVRCLTEHWANVCPRTDSKSCKLQEFALQCITSVKSIQNDVIHDFVGVPLKCRILATVKEQQAKQLCKVNRKKLLQVPETATIKSVFDLYTKFVDCLVEKVAKIVPQGAKNNFLNGILTFYTHIALELLFPDISIVYLNNSKIDSSMEEFFRRVGVVRVNNVNQRLEFIHRSFAEYFVGRFFGEFWNDIEQFSPRFVHMVGFYFIKNVLIAVDGSFVTHPDSSKQSFAWWDLIKYEPRWYYSYHSSFLDENKVFHLKYPLILLFMNMILKVNKLQIARLERPTNRFPNVGMSFETEAIATTQSLQPVDRNTNYCDPLCELKKWLSKFTFATMAACIDERLTNILSIYVQILISFFDPDERVALLLSNVEDQNKASKAVAAWLLCRAAISKSPENAVELFNLFGDSEENFFSLICQRYPQKYLSPLEVAIMTGDRDMVLYFQDKVSLPVGRLFIACIAVDKILNEPDKKLKIMKMVLGSSDRALNFLCMDSLGSYKKTAVKITKYSFQLLLKFLEDSKRSLSSIKSENKRWILEKCLEDCNDEEWANFLLSLFGKNDDKTLSIVNLAARPTFTAEVVLDALDLVEARDAFSEVNLHNLVLEDCCKLETLKVLTAIQQDFSCCNLFKWNYLHVAANMLQIDWIKYLINTGYEVDQKDAWGNTPLILASLIGTRNIKSLLAVTRILVENGANVCAKDWKGKNIAHLVFNNCRNADSKDLCEWVSYLLENGYHQLWEMKDKYGRTPQETLIKEAGEKSSITADVLRLLENYSIVSTK